MAMYKKEINYKGEVETVYEDLDCIRLIREADRNKQMRIVGWYRPGDDGEIDTEPINRDAYNGYAAMVREMLE